MVQELRGWRSILQDYNKQAIDMLGNVNAMKKDPLFAAEAKDTNAYKPYSARIRNLKIRIASADTTTSALLSKIDHLQTTVSDDFLAAIEVRKKLRKELNKFGSEIFSAHYPPLWRSGQEAETGAASRLPGEQKILHYYFQTSWESRVWMLIFGLAFFGWVFFNFRRINKSGAGAESDDFKMHFLHPLPFLGSIVTILALAPVFDLHPAAIYSNILQFWLLVALTILLWRRWPHRLFYFWLAIIAIFLAYTFGQIILHTVYEQRWLLFCISIAGIVTGVLFYPRIPRSWSLSWLIRSVIIVFICGTVAALFSNITGHVLLTQIVSGAVIFGLTQIIALTVFMQIIVEAVYLQILRLRLGEGVFAGFSFVKTEQRLIRMLTLLCTLLWLIDFTINLNLYDSIYAGIQQFLGRPRAIGSTSFTYGSIVLFFIIIYIAHFLQKNISYLWGSNNDGIPIKRGAGSQLLFTRLILLSLGFLLAVAASGLPLDKITIILGALSVGIGLGLQNIVHNLVSGIVLIFERPLEVGDSIEVGDKKGIVKEIGLRSTTLISGSGSEIIIPNGDFLSGPVVNWTLTNNFAKAALTLYLPANTDLVLANRLITEAVASNARVLTEKHPSITVENFNEKRMKLNVSFWISNIREAESIRSEVYVSISQSLAAQQIPLV